MDKLEACMIQHHCLSGNCTTSTTTKIVHFLSCFEGVNGGNKSTDSAKICAAGADLDWGPVQSCYGDSGAKEQAWEAIQGAAHAGMQTAKCFPWVVLDGAIFSDPSKVDCMSDPGDSAALVAAICKSYKGTNKPPACA
jgi:hypothetical protein